MSKTTITAISAHPKFRRFDLEMPESPDTFLTVVGTYPRPKVLIVQPDGFQDFDIMREEAMASGDRSNRLLSCPERLEPETRSSAIGRAGMIAEIINVSLVTTCPRCRKYMTMICVPRCGGARVG